MSSPPAWDLRPYSKTVVAVLFAALTAAQAVNIAGGFTTAGWLIIATAALGALGVHQIPNTPPAPPPQGHQR